MNYIASGDEMSRIDEYTINVIGIPQMVLMERAALAVYEYINSKFNKESKVLVVVEGGNNGGDGIALARILHSSGYDVEIFWGENLSKTSEAFGKQLEIARKLNLKFADDILDCGYDVVVDAVFGAGLNRAITGKIADVINAMNDVDAFKLAVDIPSGIDSTNGFVLGTAFRADATVTFGIMKMGLLTGMGYEYSGQVTVADIGIPKKAIDYIEPDLYTYDGVDVDRLLPYRKLDSHKGSYGKIGVIGGSKNMAGAAMFSAEAAYRMGCGLVRICTVEENREIMQSKLPEAMLTTYDSSDKSSIREAVKSMISWSDVIILGPGLSTKEYAGYIVEKVLKDYKETIVLDADGLNIVAQNKELLKATEARVIITPHLAEMSRLTDVKTGEIKSNKYHVAKEFAKDNNLVVVLKDSRTVVSDGGVQAYINTTGNNGMATGGSGDVLAGIIGGLCGQNMNEFEAAKLGVCLHGLAGQEAAISRGRYSMIASDIVRGITAVLKGDYYVG